MINFTSLKSWMLAAALCFAGSAMAQTELLQNAGFEEWNGGDPAHWVSTTTAGSATLSQSSDARTGSSSVMVKGASSNKRLAYEEMTLSPGTYTFSIYAKAATEENARACPGYAPVNDDNSMGTYVYGEYVNDITNAEWVQVVYTFTLEAETKVNLVVMNPKLPGKDLLLDDASLTTEDGGIVDEPMEPEPEPTPSIFEETFGESLGAFTIDNVVPAEGLEGEVWTFDKAEEETNKAYEIKPLPTYRHQLAQITFAKGNYQKAYDEFTQLLNTTMRNPELFYEAAQCKTMLKAPQQEVIALLDSAINNTDTLRIREAAPYFLARGDAYNAIDSFRQAVFDYTRYEILSGQRMNSQFYYIRSQAEIKAKLYQQALGDLAAAIILSPKEPTYYAEMASLQLRVNMLDEAIKTAGKCVELAPEYSDGYLLLGLAQVRKEDTVTGLANLEKAKELGNPQAQPLIDKYSQK